MKRLIKKAILFLTLLLTVFFVFSVSAFAYDGGEGTDSFWDEYVDSIPEVEKKPETEEDVISGVGIDSLLSEIVSAVRGEGGRAAAFFAMIFGIAMLISVSETAFPIENQAFSRQVSAAVAMISSVMIFERVGPVCFSVKESLSALTNFFSSLIPIFTGIMTAGGNINSAPVQALNMNITLSVIAKVSSSLLLPLCFALFSLALLSGIDGGGVSSVAKGIKGVFMWLLGISTTVILAAVSMQSMIAGAADSAYLRAAKYAASGMIPVVGSTVSGALATLSGGLSYVKSAVGISAVFIIISISLSPLICLLLHRLAFSVSISFLEYMGSGGGVRVFSAFRTALDALISVYVISVIIYISEIIVFIKCGVEVFG